MINFGSTGIVAGYIKQLLASFNLPTARVYTVAHHEAAEAAIKSGIKQYYERYDVVGSVEQNNNLRNTAHCYIPYIKDGRLQVYIDGLWKDYGYSRGNPCRYYYERGKHMLNLTKQLSIQNNIYDYYTHEYLGDYLRFIRDFDNIDLMPLYNCFNNRICENLKLEFRHPKTDLTCSFKTEDDQSKIYMVPIKLFQNYTIAIDSKSKVELCCGLYGALLNDNIISASLPELTYTSYSNLNFSQPVLFTDIVSKVCPLIAETTCGSIPSLDTAYTKQSELLRYLAQHEEDLKLFIKVSSNVESSIVILEGDYCNWRAPVLVSSNDTTRTLIDGVPVAPGSEAPSYVVNRTLITNELLSANLELPLISPLSLLKMNTGKSIPFSNKLLAYLLDNVITPLDEISNNIRLAQLVVEEFYKTASLKSEAGYLNYKYSPTFAGLWDPQLKQIFYQSLMSKSHPKFCDLLGYVDNDVEKYFAARTVDDKGKIVYKTILNMDLEEE